MNVLKTFLSNADQQNALHANEHGGCKESKEVFLEKIDFVEYSPTESYFQILESETSLQLKTL